MCAKKYGRVKKTLAYFGKEKWKDGRSVVMDD
jgi:hypothetical protein